MSIFCSFCLSDYAAKDSKVIHKFIQETLSISDAHIVPENLQTWSQTYLHLNPSLPNSSFLTNVHSLFIEKKTG